MKTLIVYVHLISACVAVGILLMQDLALAKTRGNALALDAIKELKQAAEIISLALIVLWVSGLTLVLIGYIDNPQEYLLNEKLWAKFTVVAILTINGIVLHHFSFPRVASSRGIMGLGSIEKILVVFTGSISTVSWLFACYLGIARSWNYTVNYGFVMFVYLGLLGTACILGCTLVSNRDILKLGNFEKALVVLSGSISTISWLFACYLAVARPWNHAADSIGMFVNLGLLGAACVLGCTIIHYLSAEKGLRINRSEEQQMLSESIPLAKHVSET